jgi:hypothetical protein
MPAVIARQSDVIPAGRRDLRQQGFVDLGLGKPERRSRPTPIWPASIGASLPEEPASASGLESGGQYASLDEDRELGRPGSMTNFDDPRVIQQCLAVQIGMGRPILGWLSGDATSSRQLNQHVQQDR